jgi:hypothetical protein
MCLGWTLSMYNTSCKFVEIGDVHECVLGWNTDSVHAIEMDDSLIKMKQYLIFVW